MHTGPKSYLKMKSFGPLSSVRFCGQLLLAVLILAIPVAGSARIYIDINAPSIRKFKIAIPDFKNLSAQGRSPELSEKLAEIISHDLSLSGYFSILQKEAFLEEEGGSLTLEGIRFKDWSVIGAELLLKGGYNSIGNSLEVEVRLFDVFWARQIMGKRILGDTKNYRRLIHRLGDEVLRVLTGHPGIFQTRIAFVGNATGHKEIYVGDYDGHNILRITNDKSIALLPRLSPDGKKVLYVSYKDGGPMLYLEDLRTGKVKRISARKGLNIGAAWTSDGKQIALTLSRQGNPDIFTMDLNGRIKERLTNNWGIDVSPSFSPDGARIAFVSNRSGSPQIYIRDLKRGTEERLTFEGNYNTSPSWSSLDRIAYASMSQGKFNIFSINPDGTGLKRLTEDQGNNEDPCWSPDGRYIMFSSDRLGRYHLFLMNGNGQNQNRITFMEGDQTAPSWSR